jgi:hypothetical protein
VGDPLDQPVKLYDYEEAYPYGYLQGHVPRVMRWQADYTFPHGTERWGKTVVGLAFRHDAGYHYSASRAAPSKFLDETGLYFGTVNGNYISFEGSEFGENYTQWQNNERRVNAFNSQQYFDLSLTVETPKLKVLSSEVGFFFKAIAFNVFNHQQLVQWAAGYLALRDTDPDGKAGAWNKQDNFGTSTAPGYWGAARSIYFSAGLRF